MAPSEGDAPPSPAPRLARPRAPLVLLLVATALVYLPAVPGEFVWDDVNLIQNNPHVRDPARLWEGLTHDFWHVPSSQETAGAFSRRYYRPVVTLAYALQYRAFGGRPLGFHLVSLGLHLACVALAHGWLRRRLARVGGATPADERARSLAALLGAAVFALHPSRPESVAWISGSTDLWMALFALLGLHAFDTIAGARGAALAAACFALATLSKEAAVVLPVLLLVDHVLLRAPGASLRAGLGRVAGAASGVALALTLRRAVMPFEAPRSARDAWAQTPERVLSTLGHYLWEAAAPWWPSIQSTVRTMVNGRAVFDAPSVALGAAGAAGVVALAWRARRSQTARPWLADALWFAVALAPALNVIPLGLATLTASRFLYLPLLGACALLGRALASQPGRAEDAARAAVGALALAFGVVSARHASTFADPVGLWEAEARRHPDNHHALVALASAAYARHDLPAMQRFLGRAFEGAVRHGAGDEALHVVLLSAELLLRSTPDDDRATLLQVRAFYDAFVTQEEGAAEIRTARFRLGVALPRREFAMRRALRLEARRAWAHFRTDDVAGAEAMLREAARRPNAFHALESLAMVLAAEGRFDESRAALDALLRANPLHADGRRLRAMVGAYAAALARAPDEVARRSLEGRLWVDVSRSQRARALVRPVHEAHPERPEPVEALVYAELADERPEAARAVAREAVARAPALAARFGRLLR
ncbi:MAG: hypothetical protein U0324_35070 [Polyangiales bacterium]